MKKLFIACALFVVTMSQSFAFYPQMSFFVNREVATVQVWNTGYQPMVCSGYAFGQTYSGMVLNSWFSSLYIMPGMYANAYVYSNYYDPFARAWAQVDCQYTW
jgi:hypothetical protein